ncbi:MAG TPA: hypothetical protein VIZ18_06025 [Ktedonobacteraceae bacterium]
MNTSPTPKIISFSITLYRWLLNMGPAEFRREYATSTLQVFRQCCRDAYRQKGAFGVICQWPALFGEAVKGLLAEYLFPYGRGGRGPMQQTVRRSIVTTFCAFMLYLVGYAAIGRITDPRPPFDAVARLHPVIGISFSIFSYTGTLALLVIVLGGLPILFVAVKRALPGGLRSILKLFVIKPKLALKLLGVALLIAVCSLGFLLAMEAIFSPPQPCTPGICVTSQPLILIILGFTAILGVVTLIVFVVLAITTSLSQAVLRSEFSEVMLRFALFPIAITTLIMGFATIAAAFWAISLWIVAPQFAASSSGLGDGQTAWVIAIVLAMACATALSAASLRNSLLVFANQNEE